MLNRLVLSVSGWNAHPGQRVIQTLFVMRTADLVKDGQALYR